MNAIADPHPISNEPTDATTERNSHLSEAEGAYHAAASDYGFESAEALVAWCYWKEARRRACDAGRSTTDRPDCETQ